MSESLITAEWSHKPTWKAASMRVDSVAIEARPRRRGTSRPLQERYSYSQPDQQWQRVEQAPLVQYQPPESLPAFQAVCWAEAEFGVDYRPHLFDPVANRHLLVDSGSQISAYPPEPGDIEDKSQCLKAVNVGHRRFLV